MSAKTPEQQAAAIAEAIVPPDAALIDRMVEVIADVMAPQDVFSREQLDEWALMNGYVPPPVEE